MNKNISLYIHIPFCKSRCTYCDFLSSVENVEKQKYFNTLKEELLYLYDKHELNKYNLSTLYFGGGTPSLIPAEYYDELFESINLLFKRDKENFEFTVECNPDSLSEEFLQHFKFHGLNRISIGVQSSDNRILKIINRPHKLEDLMEKYSVARKYIDNISFDFIIGLPEESFDSTEKTIDIIRLFSPEHISFYLLELHEDTPMYKEYDKDKITLPTVKNNIKTLEKTSYSLKEMGYNRYEISNFALKGFESKHNLRYWKNSDYIGLGASAGGHINNIRYVNSMNISEYIKNFKNTFSYYRENSEIEEFKETIFMGLRKTSGIKLRYLYENFSKKITDRFFKALSAREEILLTDGNIKLKNYFITRNSEIFEYISNI